MSSSFCPTCGAPAMEIEEATVYAPSGRPVVTLRHDMETLAAIRDTITRARALIQESQDPKAFDEELQLEASISNLERLIGA